MLFIDGACIKPYSIDTLRHEPLGGSEASLARVAARLSGSVVMQHNRQMVSEAGGAVWRPLDYTRLPETGPIVVFRNPPMAVRIAQFRPGAKVYLWLEDLGDLQLVLGFPRFVTAGIVLIAVSDYHRRQIQATAEALVPGQVQPRIEVIYNPIDDDLVPDDTPVDPDRLIFISSPHKGLDETLGLFAALRARHPALRLQIANPGYHPTPQLELAGVEVIGSLAHPQVVEHLRGAFCMFYGNVSYPETFGVVYAEANAVGLPVLAHPFGAGPEVVSGEEQLVDCRDPAKVIERFEAWRAGGRPKVEAKADFRLSNVIRDWERVADGGF